MEVRIEQITIDAATAPVMGRTGERADGKATVVVSVRHTQHEFQLTFSNHPFQTLDSLVEDVRIKVEELGKSLAIAAASPLL